MWREDEQSKVESWRLHVLIEAGFPLPLAERLAGSEVDLHTCVELLARGCAPSSPPRSCSSPARSIPPSGIDRGGSLASGSGTPLKASTSSPHSLFAIIDSQVIGSAVTGPDTLRQMSSTAGERKVYGVAEFNRRLAGYVGRVKDVWVDGEVSELKRNPAWANVFLTLKDAETGACLPATVQRRRFDAIEPALAEGERVQALGRLQLYEARGELSFRLAAVERVGAGDHAAALDRLRRQLAAEGLFAAGAEAAPPGSRAWSASSRASTPRRAATSSPRSRPASPRCGSSWPRRACRARMRRRRSSAPSTASWREDGIDVVILARGGGSFEDLLPFSDERVVRAVAASRVPIVSAVGHEQDEPLCDLAADVRAPTPTAAARLVVPDLDELHAALARAAAAARRGRRPAPRA